MRASIRLSLIPLGAMVLCCTGCLFVRHSTNVVRRDEKLKRIEYDSPEAESLFTSAVADKRADKSMGNPRVTAVPFLLWYSRTDELSDNAVFNDAVAACDVNGDRVISVDEARRFQARVQTEVAAREQKKREATAATARAGGNASLAGQGGQVVRPMPPTSPAGQQDDAQQATQRASYDGEDRRY